MWTRSATWPRRGPVDRPGPAGRPPPGARARGPARADERVATVGLWRRLLVKPELGSLIGAVVILVFFSAQSSVFRSLSGIANWLDVASTLGILAGAVAPLMIGRD